MGSSADFWVLISEREVWFQHQPVNHQHPPFWKMQSSKTLLQPIYGSVFHCVSQTVFFNFCHFWTFESSLLFLSPCLTWLQTETKCMTPSTSGLAGSAGNHMKDWSFINHCLSGTSLHPTRRKLPLQKLLSFEVFAMKKKKWWEKENTSLENQ